VLKKEFEHIYRAHFDALHRYSYSIIKDPEPAKDVVQECFINLYNRLNEGARIENIQAYLFRSVYNKSLTYLNAKESTVTTLDPSFANTLRDSGNKLESILADERSREIGDIIENVLAGLPAQCRLVFEKSRIEQKKYAEIAQELNISRKTVEVHISKALKLIREYIRVNKQHLSLLTISLIQICQLLISIC